MTQNLLVVRSEDRKITFRNQTFVGHQSGGVSVAASKQLLASHDVLSFDFSRGNIMNDEGATAGTLRREPRSLRSLSRKDLCFASRDGTPEWWVRELGPWYWSSDLVLDGDRRPVGVISERGLRLDGEVQARRIWPKPPVHGYRVVHLVTGKVIAEIWRRAR